MKKKQLTKKSMLIWVSILVGVSLMLFVVVSIFKLYDFVALPIFAFLGAICVFVVYVAKREETERLAKEKVKRDTLTKAQKTVDEINATVSQLKKDDCVFGMVNRFGNLDLQEFSLLCLTAFIYLGFGKRVDVVENAYFSFTSDKVFVVKCLSRSTKITVNDIEKYVTDERVAYKYNDGRKYILCSQGEISKKAEEVAKNKRIKVFCGDSCAYCIRLAYSKFCQYLDKYVKAKKLQLQLVDMDLAPYLPNKKAQSGLTLDFSGRENWEEKLDFFDDIVGD